MEPMLKTLEALVLSVQAIMTYRAILGSERRSHRNSIHFDASDTSGRIRHNRAIHHRHVQGREVETGIIDSGRLCCAQKIHMVQSSKSIAAKVTPW